MTPEQHATAKAAAQALCHPFVDAEARQLHTTGRAPEGMGDLLPWIREALG